MVEYWIGVSNLEIVDLPYSFEYIRSKDVYGILMNSSEWIGVSSILADLVQIRYWSSE